MFQSIRFGLLLASVACFCASAAEAITYSVVHSFAKDGVDGQQPLAAPVQDKFGNFWGTTSKGGVNGKGVIYAIPLAGGYTVYHPFANDGVDGTYPASGLFKGKKDTLWGTAQFGGADNYGVVFQVTPGGNDKVIHTFTDAANDGAQPETGLIGDTQGNLWGNTYVGGASQFGTVFKITSLNVFSVVHSFGGAPSDGAYPNSGQLLDAGGNIWGTTFQGGANGLGTIFKITPTGSYSVVYSFNGVGGFSPLAGLTPDGRGHFWGNASAGGQNGYGTVYYINQHGLYSVAHTFAADGVDGIYPVGGLVRDKNGNLWGMTADGGAYLGGTIFEITAAGVYSVVYSFKKDGADGNFPQAGLLLDKNGNFWGTTQLGGASNAGTVFAFTP
jgi:uncharacterized repeat protein (TIGR03803 family)